MRTLLFLIFTVCFAQGEINKVDLDFLKKNNDIMETSFNRSGGYLFHADFNSTEYTQAKQAIFNDVNQRLETELANNSFSISKYQDIINDAFAKNMQDINSQSVKSKLSTSKRNISNSFYCVCNSALSSAFNSIQSHLFDKNLVPLGDNLNRLANEIETSIKQIETNRKNLLEEKERLKYLLLKADEYLHDLQKTNQKLEAL